MRASAVLLLLSALPSLVFGQAGRSALDSAQFARLLALSEMPRGTRQTAEMSPDSTTYLRIFQLDGVGITVAFHVLESPDSLREYVAAMSIRPAQADSVFRAVTQQRGIVIDSQRTAPIDVEVTPGVFHTGTMVRAWSPQGPIVQAQIVVPGVQAALLVNVTGVSHPDDAAELFRAVVAASLARLDEKRPRRSNH